MIQNIYNIYPFLLVHSPVGADSRVCPNICGLYSENTRNTEKHENIHGSFAAYSCPFALNENHGKEQRHHHSVPPLSGLFGQANPLVLRADTGVCPYTWTWPSPESAPTRCPKAIQVPLVLRADTGAILRADTGVCPYTCFQGYSDPTPLGRGWGWVIPLGRGWGWVTPLGRGWGWVVPLGEGQGWAISPRQGWASSSVRASWGASATCCSRRCGGCCLRAGAAGRCRRAGG